MLEIVFLQKFYTTDTRILSPSPECYVTIWSIAIYSDTIHGSDIAITHDLVSELDIITEFDPFSE